MARRARARRLEISTAEPSDIVSEKVPNSDACPTQAPGAEIVSVVGPTRFPPGSVVGLSFKKSQEIDTIVCVPIFRLGN